MSKSARSVDMEIRRLVDALHGACSQSHTRCVLFIADGGALVSSWLSGRPGGSSWLMEIRIPYGVNSSRELLQESAIPAQVRTFPAFDNTTS